MSLFPPADDQREALHHVRTRSQQLREHRHGGEFVPSLIGRPVALYGLTNGCEDPHGVPIKSLQHGAPMAALIVWHDMHRPDVVRVAGFDHLGRPFHGEDVLLMHPSSPHLSNANQGRLMAVLA